MQKLIAKLSSAAGMVIGIVLVMWLVWMLGNVMFRASAAQDSIDRLGVCIIIAAALHAHLTTKNRS